jgi:hypothetical protein
MLINTVAICTRIGIGKNASEQSREKTAQAKQICPIYNSFFSHTVNTFTIGSL